MDEIQFDVVANVQSGITSEQFLKMLQNLLAERFRVQVHHEARAETVYELTVAKNGRRRADRDNFPILPPGLPNMACQSPHGRQIRTY